MSTLDFYLTVTEFLNHKQHDFRLEESLFDLLDVLYFKLAPEEIDELNKILLAEKDLPDHEEHCE